MTSQIMAELTETEFYNIALFTKTAQDEWSVKVQSTLMRPYQKQELQELLINAGFQEMDYYGSLQRGAFDPEHSGDLVVVAMSLGAPII